MHTNEHSPRSGGSPAVQSQIVARTDSRLWGSILQSLDNRTRFLCEDWLRLIETTYGYESRIIALHSEEQLVAALPVSIVRSRWTGNRAISIPFFDICRSFHTEAALVPQIYQSLISFGKSENLDYVEIRGDLRKLPDVEPSLSFYNHVVDLTPGPDGVFANFASSTRRAIRKAEKSGVTIEHSNSLSAVKTFYRLQCITRRRHGLPPQPFAFFKNLHDQLISKGNGQVITAVLDGTPAASGIYLVQGDLAHYKYGASDLSHQQSRCNNLVMWNALKYYAEQGYTAMDLGRNSIENEGLRRYKLSWGPTERVTYYHRYNLKTDELMPMSDGVYGWHNRIFSALPLQLAQLAGRLLYRHIA